MALGEGVPACLAGFGFHDPLGLKIRWLGMRVILCWRLMTMLVGLVEFVELEGDYVYLSVLNYLQDL